MKASMIDTFFVFVMLFVVAVGVYAAFFFQNITSTIFTMTGLNSTATTQIVQAGENFMGMWDYLLPILGIGICLSSIALSWFFPSHPIFFTFIGVMMLVVGVLVMPIISNTFETFTTSFGGTISPSLTHLNLFMLNLPLIYSVMGITMMIVTFIRSRIE